MKLNELNIPMRSGAGNILRDAGYKHLGKGGMGDVFVKPGSNYVLKLFASNDKAYLDFVKMVKANNNPHFPKFIGKLIKVTSGYYAIRMEELVHKNVGEDLKLIEWYINEKSKGPYISDESLADSKLSIERDYWNKFEKLTQKMPKLKEALDLIAIDLVYFGGHFNDLHDENVMFRKDGTLVLSDPVST